MKRETTPNRIDNHETSYYDELQSFLETNYPHRFEQCNEIDLSVIAHGLQSSKERYGASSDLPLAYHADPHSWDALRDYCAFADIVGLTADDFVDGAVAIAWHDYEQELGSGGNERASAHKVQSVMDQAGYTIGRQTHAANCILTTEVSFDDNGRMMQHNLKSFGPDPTILAVSMADVYGIPMHGEKVMVDHALRLTMEIHQLRSLQQVRDNFTFFVDMLKQQYSFVGTRLSTLPDAVYYHMQSEEEGKRVLTELDQQYGPASSMAINAAKTIYEKITSSTDQITSSLYDIAASAHDIAGFTDEVASFAHLCALTRKLGKQATKS